jgi:multidrug resistance efflux pump
VDVYSKNQGLVSKVLVKDGQKVIAGTPLLELDRGPLQAQLLLAESGLAQARSGLSQAYSGVASQNAAVDAARTGLDAANTALAVAYESKQLADDGVFNAQEFLDFVSALSIPDPIQLQQAEAALRQAKAGQQQAAAGVAQAEGGIASARGALAQAQAGNPGSTIGAANAAIAAGEEQVALATQALEDAVIIAPVAGTVIFAPTTATAQSMATGGGTPLAGATLMAGSAITQGVPLLTLVDTGRMRFVAEVDERDIGRLSLDQSATVTLDSFGQTTFEGTVVKLSPQTQTTRTGGTVFLVDILLDTKDETLAIGMKGDTLIKVSTQTGATTIPLQALFSEGSKDYVYVAFEGKLVKTAITAGEKTDTHVEVLRGVGVGDQVALASNIPYTDGMRVKVR